MYTQKCIFNINLYFYNCANFYHKMHVNICKRDLYKHSTD